MSVFMMLQVEGDPKRLADVMSDSERWKRINARAVEHGAIHHRVFASTDGGTIAVFDEWESEGGFQTFFRSSPEIPELTREAGVTTEPRIAFWHPVDTPDQF
jgi:hypothetical protein